MKRYFGVALLGLFVCMSFSKPNEWIKEQHAQYNVFFTTADQNNKEAYCGIIDTGIASVKSFFGDNFKSNFDVYIHPNRLSLNEQWQKDWNMPDFKSECWMVASGIATKIDMISPVRWKEEACEHTYENKIKTQQLITHELFHVYHAQLNTSPDFSDAVGINWLVEGFATYASGQLDQSRIDEIKTAIKENRIPVTLDKFWTGKLRYGLSGSLVMYIDHKFGRAKLRDLLALNQKAQVLNSLNLSEEDLLKAWSDFMTIEK